MGFDFDGYNPNIKKLELVIEDVAKANSLIGKRITLKGTLFGAENGHHHTSVLMQVGRIIENKN